MRSFFYSLAAALVAFSSQTVSFVSAAGAAGYMDQNTYTAQGTVPRVRRENNLDHWDSDTLAYYLDDYQGVDVAIMFYAQWDSNSRALAPHWNQIAADFDAGTTDSRLILALFDCEVNAAHSEMCKAVGITHYPTMLFVGSGPYHDTDPFTRTLFGGKSAGMMGDAPVYNTVKFQGTWQYVDAIKDWIRAMQALSNWHTWTTEGFGRRLRNLFFPHKTPNTQLPIGIPASGSAAARSDGHGGNGIGDGNTGASSMVVKDLEGQVKELTEITSQYDKMLTRSMYMMDSVLMPLALGSSIADMFTLMHQENAWTPSDEVSSEILRNCVTELSLDYCQRLSQQVANELVEDLLSQGKTADDLLAMPDLEDQILQRIVQVEPYCGVLDQCIISDYAGPECQPQECPFRNPAACQYLTACLKPELQQDYANALGMSTETADPSATTSEVPVEPESAGTGEQKRGRWGM